MGNIFPGGDVNAQATLTAFIDESYVYRWVRHGPDREKEASKVGRRLLIGAAVTSQASLLNDRMAAAALTAIANDALWEPREGNKTPDQRRANFDKDGFHFTVDSPALRQIALNAMTPVDLRFHAIYHDLELGQEKDPDAHLAMLYTLTQSLVQRYSGFKLEIVIENEDAIGASRLGGAISHAIQTLDRKKRPRATVYAKVGRKPLGGLAAADAALALVNADLPGLRWVLREDERRLLHQASARLAHVMNYDVASHRRKFDTVEPPSWVRHIVDASSHPGVDEAIPKLIPVDSAGPFAYVQSRDQLATKLGYTAQTFAEVSRRAQLPESFNVRPVTIKGKRREISTVSDQTVRDLHRRLALTLRYLTEFLHPSCSGYVPGRGAVDAAAPHAGNRVLQRLDIKSFFESITTERVALALQDFGAHDDVSQELAMLLTLDGVLPTGFTTSPLLSNLILTRFDYRVARWAESQNIRYTRYADDLVFSSDGEFDATEFVSAQLDTLGLSLNPLKSKVRKRGQPFRVAGLTVHESSPRVRKTLKRRLRIELFLLQTALQRLGAFPGNVQDLLGDLDEDDYYLLRHVRGLARYGLGVERDWTTSLLSRFDLAREAVIPPRRERNVTAQIAQLAERVRSAAVPLSDQFTLLSQPQPLV